MPKLQISTLVPTPVEDLFPGGEAHLEVPERGPDDWMIPVNDEFAHYYLRDQAEYLDTALSRLYRHSITFRGLLETRRDIAQTKIKVSDFLPYASDFNMAAGSKNPEQALMENDPAGLISLWMTAYKYRELQQKNSVIKPGQSHPADIRSALALNRAVHADCSTFAATCLFETLSTSGFEAACIPELLKNTKHHWVLEAVAATSLSSRELLATGAAQTLGFKAYLSNRNKGVTRALDHDFLTAAQALKGQKESVPSFSQASMIFCFNVLKTMPYLSPNGAPVERAYLAKVDFSEIEKLDHTGLANRIAILKHRTPF